MATVDADRCAFLSPADAAGRLTVQAVMANVMAPAPGQPGHCRLEAGQALTMQVPQAGRLCVVQGRLWVTFRNAAQDSRVRAGDHFLLPGDSLALAAGDAVVMESWAVGQAAPAWVRWEPAPLARLTPVFRGVRWLGRLAFAVRQ